MKISIKSIIQLLLIIFSINAFSQTTAIDFTLTDCNGKSQSLYPYIDNGKVVILIYEHQCSSCVTGTTNVKSVINTYYPGDTNILVMYLDNAGLSCSSTQTWITSHNFIPGPYFAYSNDYSSPYGTGMPVIVVAAGSTRKVYLIAKSPTQASTAAIKTAIHDAFSELSSINNNYSLSQNLKTGKEFINSHDISIEIQSAINQTISFQLFDYSGKLLFHQPLLKLNQGNNYILIPKTNLHSGICIYCIRNDKGEIIRKLIIPE